MSPYIHSYSIFTYIYGYIHVMLLHNYAQLNSHGYMHNLKVLHSKIGKGKMFSQDSQVYSLQQNIQNKRKDGGGP